LNQRIADTQEAAMTGLRVNAPSDEPQLWQEIYGIEDSVNDQSQFQENSTFASALLGIADVALEESHDVIVGALELAVAFSSDIYTANERVVAAEAADALVEQIVDLANVNMAGRYIFGGTAYDNPPFAPDGTYTGSTERPTTRVGNNNWSTTGYDGSSIFSDAIVVLQDLADALRVGDADDVANTLEPLQDVAQDVVMAREAVGFDLVDTLDAHDVAENLKVALQERQQSLIGADPFETYSELSNLQVTYQAAMQITSQTLGKSLFDYMR
jgi:flagellar hook-associated protein 3 FlgL